LIALILLSFPPNSCQLEEENDDGDGAGGSITDLLCGRFRKSQQTCRSASLNRRVMNVVYGVLMLALFPAVFYKFQVGVGACYTFILLWAVLNVSVYVLPECTEYGTRLVSIVLIPFAVVMLILYAAAIVKRAEFRQKPQ
jgi:hypothetical protein